MRKMNRLAAMLAILMMSSTMAATTYADEPAATEAATLKGSITVQNTVKDAEYTIYKIFDATVNGDAVSYTLPDGATYESINKFFDLSTNGGKTYVQLKSGVDNAALFNWLKDKGTKFGDTKKGTGSNLKFGGLDYGYYYIKSSVEGGAATMISSATPDAFVQEKNGEPSWGDGSKTTDTDTYSIGDTITYTVEYKNALNFYTTENKDGTSTAHKIYQYVLDDTMPTAVTLKTELENFKVWVNDNAVKVDNKNDGDSDAVVTINGNNFKVTIPWAETHDPKTDGTKEDFYYDAVPATIKVTYQGVLTKDATLGSTVSEDVQKNTNRATINPNETRTDSGKDKEVYSGKITINKVDGTSKTPLEGAKFVVIDKVDKDGKADTGAKYLKYDEKANDNKGAFSWMDSLGDATVYTTNDKGEAAISGLAAGKYYLLEIEAPRGYNVLTAAQPVTLTKGVDDNKVDHLLVTPQVANNKGIELPSTGGMGTVAFAVVGLIVMAGAAVTLIIKKRA